jgi:hypothetical protein
MVLASGRNVAPTPPLYVGLPALLAPTLDLGTGGLFERIHLVGVLPLLLDAFAMVADAVPDQPITLASVRASAASEDVTNTAWAGRTAYILRQQFASDWPHIGVGSSHGPLPPTVESHLRLVCRLPPTGTPEYARLGGAYASIGLHFKGFSLRCSGTEGLPPHARSPCLWCGEADAECGIHLLVCEACPGPADRQIRHPVHHLLLSQTTAAGAAHTGAGLVLQLAQHVPTSRVQGPPGTIQRRLVPNIHQDPATALVGAQPPFLLHQRASSQLRGCLLQRAPAGAEAEEAVARQQVMLTGAAWAGNVDIADADLLPWLKGTQRAESEGGAVEGRVGVGAARVVGGDGACG